MGGNLQILNNKSLSEPLIPVRGACAYIEFPFNSKNQDQKSIKNLEIKSQSLREIDFKRIVSNPENPSFPQLFNSIHHSANSIKESEIILQNQEECEWADNDLDDPRIELNKYGNNMIKTLGGKLKQDT